MENKKKAIVTGSIIAAVLVLAFILWYVLTIPYAVTAEGEKVKEPYSVCIDGKEVAMVSSEDEGNQLVNSMKNYYVNDAEKVESVSVKQELTVVPKEMKHSRKHPQVDNIEQKLTVLMTGTDNPTTYTVKDGDTAWDLADQLDIPFENLDAWNADKDLDFLQIGDELNTYEPKPSIEVTTKEKITYETTIKHKTEVIETANMYVGETKVEKKGRDGVKRINAVVTTVNGVETGRKITAKKVLKKAKTRVVYKGTAERPTYDPNAVSAAASSSDSGTSSVGSGKGSSVVAYARQFIGNPYVYGGSSLTHGTDCSGFTMSVYSHFGYSLPHNSWAQLSSGRSVSYSEAKPGDLIIYGNHVALYAGGGQIIHASNPRTGIKTGSATYRKILGVRRIIN